MASFASYDISVLMLVLITRPEHFICLLEALLPGTREHGILTHCCCYVPEEPPSLKVPMLFVLQGGRVWGSV